MRVIFGWILADQRTCPLGTRVCIDSANNCLFYGVMDLISCMWDDVSGMFGIDLAAYRKRLCRLLFPVPNGQMQATTSLMTVVGITAQHTAGQYHWPIVQFVSHQLWWNLGGIWYSVFSHAEGDRPCMEDYFSVVLVFDACWIWIIHFKWHVLNV